MSLIDFSNNSQTKLRGVLGSFDTKIQERVARSQVGYIENQYFKITEQVDIEAEGDTDASTEFKAIEVQPNGEEVSNGIVFDSDANESTNVNDPIYLPNLKFNTELFSGSVEVGKAYTVEEVDSDTFGETSDWYVIPKGGAGGGTTMYRLRILEDAEPIDGDPDSNYIRAELILEGDIREEVRYLQTKFSNWKFYENETLYGIAYNQDFDGFDVYLGDPFLAGIGVDVTEVIP